MWVAATAAIDGSDDSAVVARVETRAAGVHSSLARDTFHPGLARVGSNEVPRVSRCPTLSPHPNLLRSLRLEDDKGLHQQARECFRRSSLTRAEAWECPH